MDFSNGIAQKFFVLAVVPSEGMACGLQGGLFDPKMEDGVGGGNS
jgi:hypothetical protein